MRLALRKMLRLPAVEAPKNPPASDVDLPKNGEANVPLGGQRFSWLNILCAKADIVRLYLRGTVGIQSTRTP